MRGLSPSATTCNKQHEKMSDPHDGSALIPQCNSVPYKHPPFESGLFTQLKHKYLDLQEKRLLSQNHCEISGVSGGGGMWRGPAFPWKKENR